MSAGAVLVWSLIGFAGLLVVPAVSHTNAGTTFSLMASSMAFTGMALALFMATRPPFIERLFGGLDRIYQTHRRVGITVLVLILVHYFITPDFKGLSLTGGLNKLAADAGKYAFYALVVLLLLSIVKIVPKTKVEIPYHFWPPDTPFHRSADSSWPPSTRRSSSGPMTARRCWRPISIFSR